MEILIDEEEVEAPKLWKTIIVFIIISALLLPLMFYLYPRSAIGNPLCKEMSAQGYYETEWDTAGYKDCRIDYDSKWNPYETNMSCMEERLKIDEKNLSEYGFHCVWGGAGYWIFVLYMAIPFLLFAIFVMLIGVIYSEIKKKNQKEVG